jgi:hypothetical protein
VVLCSRNDAAGYFASFIRDSGLDPAKAMAAESPEFFGASEASTKKRGLAADAATRCGCLSAARVLP